MNPEEFKRTRQLFDAALERSRPERKAFLAAACGSDVGLLRQVERLLEHAEGDADPLERAGAATAPAQRAAAPVNLDGSVGTLAPSFDLPCISAEGRSRSALADFRGRWLVLVFYPRDFSLICPTELTALSARIDEFREVSAEILGISVDSVESHERWLTTPKARGGLGGLRFPLASDVDGAVSRAYGIYLEPQHVALRGLFIIDPNGVLQYKSVHNLSVGRRSDDVLRVMTALQTGGLCAEDWSPGLDPIDPVEALSAGRVLSHYRLEECIGRGAFGCVFRARDMELDRPVALKVFSRDCPLAASAVLAEARAAAALNHTNVCTVFAVDDSEGIPFIAMEYVDGRPLEALLGGALMLPERAAHIAGQIAAGMAAAHAMGISHGDLKPANVLVRDDGVAKILDFGLARLGEHSLDPNATHDARHAKAGGLEGTPAYMSPEQASGGQATRHSDVFSLGTILYEMLTGRRAFPGPSIPDLLSQVQAADPDRYAATVDEPFASVLRRALVCDPSHRDITMEEIARTLQDVHGVSAAPTKLP